MCMKQERERFEMWLEEREVRIKSNTKIADSGIRGESRGGRVTGQVY